GPGVSVGVSGAGYNRAVPTRALDQVPLPPLRASLARRFGLGLGVALDVRAFRIPRAADELSVPAGAELQRLPTVGARLVQQLRLGSFPLGRQCPAELALRVPRAAHEGTEPARLPDEVALVAARADLVPAGRL